MPTFPRVVSGGIKISEMPVAPVAGTTDQIEVNQGGTTRRVTLDQMIDRVVGSLPPTGWINPLDEAYGAIGDGVANDTAALTAAVAASYGKTLYIPRGYTFLTDNLVITPPAGSSFTMTGGGTIRRRNGAPNGSLLTLAGSGEITCNIFDITVDGNDANQPAPYTYGNIRCSGTGTATAYCTWNIDRVRSINAAGIGDFYVMNNNRDRATLERVRISRCTLIGGRQCEIGIGTEQPVFINISSAVDYIVDDNWLGLATPAVLPKAGKAGIVVTIGGADGATGSPQGVIADNMVVRCGHPGLTPTAGEIGAIDIYHNGHSLAITGNTVIEPLGRGIQAKSDALSVTVTGNSCRGYQDPCSGHFIVNGSTNPFVNGNIVVSGNVSEGSQNDGITLVGYSVEDAALFATAYVVSGNSVRNAGGKAIHINTTMSAIVVGNHVDQCFSGIWGSAHKKHLKISSNSVRNPTSTNSPIFVSPSPAATVTIVDNSIGYDSGASFTGSIAGTVLTVTAMVSGQLNNGQLLTGAGIAAGTRIVAPISPAVGGIGTYTVSSAQTVASEAMTSAWAAGGRAILIQGCAGGMICNNHTEGMGIWQMMHLSNITGPMLIAGNVSDSTAATPILDNGGNTNILLGQNYFKNSVAEGPQTKTADFTLGFLDTTVIANKAGSTCVVTLPAATDFPGREVTFINYQAQLLNSASANVVPLGGGAAAAGILSAAVGKYARLKSNDLNWVIVGGAP